MSMPPLPSTPNNGAPRFRASLCRCSPAPGSRDARRRVVTISLRASLPSSAERMAALSDSVPPEVNTISWSMAAPSSACTCSRACLDRSLRSRAEAVRRGRITEVIGEITAASPPGPRGPCASSHCCRDRRAASACLSQCRAFASRLSFRSSGDRDDAHEFAEPLHQFGLDALERGAAQLAKHAGAGELDHDLVAVDLDQLAVASVALQIRTNLLDHRLDDRRPLVTTRRQFLRDFRFDQHGFGLLSIADLKDRSRRRLSRTTFRSRSLLSRWDFRR